MRGSEWKRLHKAHLGRKCQIPRKELPLQDSARPPVGTIMWPRVHSSGVGSSTGERHTGCCRFTSVRSEAVRPRRSLERSERGGGRRPERGSSPRAHQIDTAVPMVGPPPRGGTVRTPLSTKISPAPTADLMGPGRRVHARRSEQGHGHAAPTPNLTRSSLSCLCGKNLRRDSSFRF